jgi:hypothetical protein
MDEQLNPKTRARMRWVSVFIVAFLVLQGFNTISLHKRLKYLGLDRETRLALKKILAPPNWYPFFDYPMYSKIHKAGDRIKRYEVFALLEDGTEVPLSHEDLGTTYWIFKKRFVSQIRKKARKKLSAFISIYEERNGVVVIALRLDNAPVVVDADGYHEAPRKRVTTVRLRPEPL